MKIFVASTEGVRAGAVEYRLMILWTRKLQWNQLQEILRLVPSFFRVTFWA